MAKSVYGNLVCRGCAYAELAGGWYVCCYFLDTGKRRPCPGGKGCTVRKTATASRRKRAMTAQAQAQIQRKKARDEERMALYRQGLSDRAIAQELGLTSSTIRIWRVDKGLPPNVKTGRHRKEEQTNGESDTVREMRGADA